MNHENSSTFAMHFGNAVFKDKSVVVTGGAGFLGSWMCDALIQLGARVVCIDNLSSGLAGNISHLLPHERFHFINHDISQKPDIGIEVDMVMHLASRASPLEFDKFPIDILRSNTLGTMNALEIARTNNARFVFTSTSEAYGDAEEVPTPETYYGRVNPVGIRGCYDEGKRAGEAMCMAFLRQYGTDVRIARIFNTYGPRMRFDGYYGRVIPRFIHQALQNKPITVFGDGNQTRSFCYVTDQVNGLLKLGLCDSAKGEVINIGNPDEITVLHLAGLIMEYTQSTSPMVFEPLPEDDPRRRCPVIKKAEAILDWVPHVPISEGLKNTIRHIRQKLTGTKK